MATSNGSTDARAPWYRRLLASPRYLVLAIAGVLIIGGGAAFGISGGRATY